MLAGVELGGTKCVCILGAGPQDIRAQQVLPTGDAASTLAAIAAVLDDWRRRFGAPDAIGVAAFGPLQLRRERDGYGRIGATPKPGWAGADLAGFFGARFGVPVGLTTDVIGAALAEGRWGSARGLQNFAYVTVGTGIGVGLIASGHPLIGAHHPELGHIRVVRYPGDSWPGSCRFHGDCLEGLASGPAIEARSGAAAGALRADSPIWDGVAHALAQLAHILVLSTAPERILIGGGVASAQPQLFARIAAMLQQSLGGYLDVRDFASGPGEFIAPPGLGTLAGPLGALAVAADACAQR